MSTIAAAVTAITVGSLGTDMCLKAVSLTCNKALDSVAYFTTTALSHRNFEDFNRNVKKKCLPQILNTIKATIFEFIEQLEKGYQFKNSVKLSIQDVDQAIKDIDQILSKVKQLELDYRNSYIGYWHNTDCTGYIDSININADVLQLMYNKLNMSVEMTVNLHNMIATLPTPPPLPPLVSVNSNLLLTYEPFSDQLNTHNKTELPKVDDNVKIDQQMIDNYMKSS